MEADCRTEEIELSPFFRWFFPKACWDIEIHEKCKGCPRIKWDQICSTYGSPKLWWEHYGGCPFHPSKAKERMTKEEEFKKLNPMKASMRKAKGK